VYSNPEWAGRGIIVFTSPDRAVNMARSQAFTDSSAFEAIGDLNAAESPKWRVEPVEGKGMGLIAAKNLQIGDHIMSVTASVMIDYNLFSDVSDADLSRMQVDGIGYLPPKHQASILNLSTHDEVDNYATRVSKVILTNAFDISSAGVAAEDEEETFYTVFPESE
jgi:hypothetical protein